MSGMALPNLQQPKCLASTGNTYCASIVACHAKTNHAISRPSSTLDHHHHESNCFRSAQLSADGSTVVTHSEDLRFRSFVLPVNLLEPSEDPLSLSAYSTSTHPVNSRAFVLYPGFNLAHPNTTWLLHSRLDQPIRLASAFSLDTTSYSYPWIHPNTEAFRSPQSLIFTNDGTRFVAGGDGVVAIFDVLRDGEGPLKSYPTKNSKHAKAYASETALTGYISSLAISSRGVLAAGTFNRQIALYDGEGQGDLITSFPLYNDIHSQGAPRLKGAGITQLTWSDDGIYLFVAERQSDVVQIFDMRAPAHRLGWLEGRQARTSQRLSFDLCQRPERPGVDVWAGGTDGVVKAWIDVTSKEGAIKPEESLSFKASSDAVSSIMLHPTEAVFVTASGQRQEPSRLYDFSDSEDGDDGSSVTLADTEHLDNALKAWAMNPLTADSIGNPP